MALARMCAYSLFISSVPIFGSGCPRESETVSDPDDKPREAQSPLQDFRVDDAVLIAATGFRSKTLLARGWGSAAGPFAVTGGALAKPLNTVARAGRWCPVPSPVCFSLVSDLALICLGYQYV